jgi:hypothetical protein
MFLADWPFDGLCGYFKCFCVHVEAFRKLPKSRGIIFAVHPLVRTLGSLANSPLIPALLHKIHTDSAPELIVYKVHVLLILLSISLDFLGIKWLTVRCIQMLVNLNDAGRPKILGCAWTVAGGEDARADTEWAYWRKGSGSSPRFQEFRAGEEPLS